MVKRMGDNSPPCRTPLETVKGSEVCLFQRTLSFCSTYQWCSSLTTADGRPRETSVSNKTSCLTKSKALEASRKHANTDEPPWMYLDTTFFNTPVHKHVEREAVGTIKSGRQCGWCLENRSHNSTIHNWPTLVISKHTVANTLSYASEIAKR